MIARAAEAAGAQADQWLFYPIGPDGFWLPCSRRLLPLREPLPPLGGISAPSPARPRVELFPPTKLPCGTYQARAILLADKASDVLRGAPIRSLHGSPTHHWLTFSWLHPQFVPIPTCHSGFARFEPRSGSENQHHGKEERSLPPRV